MRTSNAHWKRLRAKFSRWGRASVQARAAKRMECGVDADTARAHALDDARGQLLRHGCTYVASGETHWEVRRSLRGRVSQFDLIANGALVWTRGPRRLPRRFRP